LENTTCNGGEYTAKYAPWEDVVVVRSRDRTWAERFERYLKSGSGHAFARRQFW
jgi:hypothetical protein